MSTAEQVASGVVFAEVMTVEGELRRIRKALVFWAAAIVLSVGLGTVAICFVVIGHV